jgi:uncharacterized repeat protein (TIGR03803 family)
MKSTVTIHFSTMTLLIVGISAFSLTSQAQTFTVLHTFTGSPDGAYPVPGLIRNGAGNLYGTTEGGGISNAGTVFKLNKSERVSVLYSFTGGDDGGFPFAPLSHDAHGNLYGTTSGRGAFGAGTVFKLDTAGNETVLYSFTGGLDGALPYAGLVGGGPSTVFFGTTQSGGSGASYGTIFKVDTTGKERVLYTFAGGSAGEYPFAGLVWDKGELYGTTSGDGTSVYGTVFKLTSSGKGALLHTFTGTPDGAFPIAVLVRDAAGNLYGTTQQGGRLNAGTVFKLDTTTDELTVLHSFAGNPDGKWPYAGLVRDAAGNFYGTTTLGGAFDSGTIFKLDTTGKVTILYSFTGSSDGSSPRGGLVLDEAGNLYGTATNGGDSTFGTVFKFTLSRE